MRTIGYYCFQKVPAPPRVVGIEELVEDNFHPCSVCNFFPIQVDLSSTKGSKEDLMSLLSTHGPVVRLTMQSKDMAMAWYQRQTDAMLTARDLRINLPGTKMKTLYEICREGKSGIRKKRKSCESEYITNPDLIITFKTDLSMEAIVSKLETYGNMRCLLQLEEKVHIASFARREFLFKAVEDLMPDDQYDELDLCLSSTIKCEGLTRDALGLYCLEIQPRSDMNPTILFGDLVKKSHIASCQNSFFNRMQLNGRQKLFVEFYTENDALSAYKYLRPRYTVYMADPINIVADSEGFYRLNYKVGCSSLDGRFEYFSNFRSCDIEAVDDVLTLKFSSLEEFYRVYRKHSHDPCMSVSEMCGKMKNYKYSVKFE